MIERVAPRDGRAGRRSGRFNRPHTSRQIRSERAVATPTNVVDRCGLAVPVQTLDERDLVAERELQSLQRAQAQGIRRGSGLLLFDAGLDGGAAVTKRLYELVHGIASWLSVGRRWSKLVISAN